MAHANFANPFRIAFIVLSPCPTGKGIFLIPRHRGAHPVRSWRASRKKVMRVPFSRDAHHEKRLTGTPRNSAGSPSVSRLPEEENGPHLFTFFTFQNIIAPPAFLLFHARLPFSRHRKPNKAPTRPPSKPLYRSSPACKAKYLLSNASKYAERRWILYNPALKTKKQFFG